MGIKSREIYEAPAAVVLHVAHSELEKFVIARDLERIKHDMGRVYADAVYNGLWFSQTREAIDAFVGGDSAPRHRHGAAQAVQGRLPRRRTPIGLRALRSELATYDAGDRFDHAPPKASSRSGACRPKPRRASARPPDAGGALTMAHLWSGRFAGDPDAALFEFGASFRFDRRLFEDDVTRQPGVGGGARARRACCRRPTRARDPRRARARSLEQRSQRSGVLRVRGGAQRRGRPLVRRARAGRARRRRRPPAAHRPLAQRAGRGRSAPVPEAADSRAAAGDRGAGRACSPTRPTPRATR